MSSSFRPGDDRAARRFTGAIHSYQIYGLRLHVNRALEGLAAARGFSSSDYEIIMETAPSIDRDEYRLAGRENHDGLVTVSRSKNAPSYLIEYADGSRFVIDQRERVIWCDWPPPYTTEDAVTYLVGPVLAFVLRLEGTLALHASAVDLDGRAVLFLGPAGSGKSTLAAAMAKRGHAVLSDDVAAISWRYGRPWVLPAYPRLRIWPDAAAGLYGSSTDLPALTPNWDKRYVDLDASRQFRSEEAVVGSIFFLQSRVEDAPHLLKIEGHRAAMAIIGQTSMTTYLDSDMRARELAQVTRLLEFVRVYELAARDRVEDLEQLCAIIAAHARK